jgi:hypothetical protein
MSTRGHRPCKCCIHPKAKELSEELLNHLFDTLENERKSLEKRVAALNRNVPPAVKQRTPTEPLMTRRQRQAMKGRTFYKPKVTLEILARKYGVSKAGLLRHRVHLLRAMKFELRERDRG